MAATIAPARQGESSRAPEVPHDGGVHATFSAGFGHQQGARHRRAPGAGNRAVRDSRHTHHSTRDLVERATFSSNPMTSAERLGAGLTPWGAVQEAAWAARKDDPGSAHAA